ncbi:heavy-metal-associated domain-containing protein [Gemmatimonas sp.]|uniref:heavy-metal-associated domain-containing protein n=1 Tax=Gemmatimonas sp. TaxID=1962908 RepID=UPI003983D3BB
MKTSTLQVHDMLSVLSVDEVERRIGEVPGVASVTVDFAAGRATVRYDETRLENADIKSAVRQRGFESTEPGAPPMADEVNANPAPVEPAAPPAPIATGAALGTVSDAGSSSTETDAPTATSASAPKPDAPGAAAENDPEMPPMK